MIPNIRRVYPDLHILVFSMQPAEIYGEALKQYGINYYLSKSVGEEEMIQVLQKFLQNETPIRRNDIHHHDNPFKTLAPRELEILHYVLKGIGTKEIGETLNLKMNTVSTIKNRIYENQCGKYQRTHGTGHPLQCKLLSGCCNLLWQSPYAKVPDFTIFHSCAGESRHVPNCRKLTSASIYD